MIIFINGSINSGKSTVAKILAKKIERPAIVEIDKLSEFIEWMPIEEKVSLNLENAALVIKNFLRNKFNIIVPYPLSKNNYDYFKSELSNCDKIFVFTLNPKLETVIQNRGNREITDWEKERIKYHYSIGINNPDFGEIIDNTEQTPEETASIIFDLIDRNKSMI
jgi:adenylate kinase family enzyme